MKQLILLFLLYSFSSFSQEISGTLTDEQGTFLPFGSVYLKRVKVGARSDLDGKFVLNLTDLVLSQQDTLIASYVGYETTKIPLFLNKSNNDLKIVLINKIKQLDEVEVIALKPFPALDIVEKAIDNRKENYIRDEVLADGFYRELTKEEDKWMVMNEAVIQLKYSKYPQKHFIRQAFNAYYDYDVSGERWFTGNIFRHMHRFASYIPIHDDQVKIVSSRISRNFSKRGNDINPVGGPGDLVALDKIKYSYDFLDSKILKKYNFRNVGQETRNGERCYVIDFYPNEVYNKRVFQSLGDKLEFPFYVGRIYITGVNFAVVHFEYEMANNIDFSVYRRQGDSWGIPDFLKVSVNYSPFEGKWMLNNVHTEQGKYEKMGDKKTLFICYRSLTLENQKYQEVNFNKDSIAYITKTAQLRTFSNVYNDTFWTKFEAGNNYPKLDKKVVRDLGGVKSLQKQFRSLNIPIEEIPVPTARKELTTSIHFSDTLTDNYAWLRNSNDTNTTAYLEAENQYFDDIKSKFQGVSGFYRFTNSIFKPDTNSITLKKSQYVQENNVSYCFSKDENGDFCLYKLIADSTDTLLLNITLLEQSKMNCYLEKFRFSTSGQFAYMYSEKGGNLKTIIITGMNEDKTPIEITEADNFYWINEQKLIYTKLDASRRIYQLRSYDTKTNSDELIYEEKNSRCDLTLERTTSKEHLFLIINGSEENEFQLIEVADNRVELRTVLAKNKGHIYQVEHREGTEFYASDIQTNGDNGLIHFELQNGQINEVYHTKNRITDLTITPDFVAIQEFEIAATKLVYIHKKSKKVKDISFNEPTYSFYFDKTPMNRSCLDTLGKNIISVEFMSPKTPFIYYTIDLDKQVLVANDSLELNWKRATTTKVIYAQAVDKVKVPIHVSYQDNFLTDGFKGVILKGYGAYGATQFPEFSSEDRVFMDAGYVIAYAIIRGGAELGNDWYQNGKLFNKINTFEDYVACAKFVTEEFKISPKQLIGYGSSAGGLIMGYVANNYPELFGTLIFDRPFLDVINTMCDSTLTLTTLEYDEWGNPRIEKDYKYIRTYSPYQNIQPKNYPNMVFLAGLQDDQTPYWQIAKSVAAYRANNLSNSLIIFRTDMQTGHKGSSSGDNSINTGAQAGMINYTQAQYLKSLPIEKERRR